MPAWAMVVGINRYPARTGQRALRGAVADACDFAEWALDPEGGKVAHERMLFWTHPWPARPGPFLAAFLASGNNQWELFNDDPGAPPLRPRRGPFATEIVNTAETAGSLAYQQSLAEEEEDDDNQSRKIYVFFAGHGVRAQEKSNPADQTCFLAYDFKTTRSSTVHGLVPCESFRSALLTNRFDQVILFLDCCRTTTSRVQEKAIPICDTAKVRPGSIWGQGNAAQDGQIAFETTVRPVRGAFTKALMEGLRGRRVDDQLHMEVLRDYLILRIGAHTSQGQKPAIDYEPKDPPGPLVVEGPATAPLPSPPPPSPGPVANVAALPAGTVLELIGNDDTRVPGVPLLTVKGPTVQIPQLPDGIYEIRVVGNPAQRKFFRQPTTASIDVP